MKDYYTILNISKNATKEEIKKSYRNIILKCHPDKLSNISDIKIKNEKIEQFKDATEAYNYLLKNEDDFVNIDFNLNIWDTIFDYLMKFKNFKVIKHSFNLDVSYTELFNNSKRKIRILLNNIEDPIFTTMECTKYPKIVINHIDDDSNDHEITINMILKSNNELYSHIINIDNTIDLIITIECSFKEYIIGFTKDIKYINNNIIVLNIPPFTLTYIYNNYGLKNGNLIVNIIPSIIKIEEWNTITDDDKLEMIRILNAI